MASSERNGRETPRGFYVTILPPINPSGDFRIDVLKKIQGCLLEQVCRALGSLHVDQNFATGSYGAISAG